MELTKFRLLWPLLVLLFLLGTATAVPADEVQYQPLPGFGKQVALPGRLVFTYEFVQRPQLGTVVLRIRVYDADKNQVTPLQISGRSDMPSMAGAHDSGEVLFKLNRKGDYLLPVNLVMPGEWEVKLIFKKGDESVFAGAFRFDV